MCEGARVHAAQDGGRRAITLTVKGGGGCRGKQARLGEQDAHRIARIGCYPGRRTGSARAASPPPPFTGDAEYASPRSR